jgi:arabinogalactan endo-1,4-beta-galactosidase
MRAPLFRAALAALLACAGASCATPNAPAAPAPSRYFAGADLSWVNELEDCGAQYRVGDTLRDPYEALAAAGMNAVRVRVWVNPTRTDYSTLHDAARSIRRAKALGLKVLLDFHYSDDWADPGKQVIPAAWAADIDNVDALAARVRNYTTETLTHLGDLGWMPDMVQVGNEINSEILRPAGTSGAPINWTRNAALINAGIAGVRAVAGRYAVTPKVMLHIAQPENVAPWFDAAKAAGVTDFDVIGISYYPFWSEQSIAQLGQTVRAVRERFGKDVIVVETGYGWSPEGAAVDPNSEAAQRLEPGYPPSIDGQRRFLIDVANAVIDNGGVGVFYWEPAVARTPCWPQRNEAGARWTNSLFDPAHGNALTPAAQFFSVIAGRGR